MFVPCIFKSIAQPVSILGLIIVTNLVLIDSAYSFSVTFSNSGFESTTNGSPDSWSTIGDVHTTEVIDGINPLDGTYQAIITNAYIEGNYADPIGNRNDDSSFSFNQSFTNPVSADTNTDGDILQEHFGFNSDAFSISRNPEVADNPRTSKEGSGMYQDIVVTLDPGETSFLVSFDWAYLTNDGSTTIGGEQDFSFWSLGQISGSSYTTAFSNLNPGSQINVLESSSGAISDPSADNDYVSTFNYATNGTNSYTVDGLSAGTYTYRLGFGVVDVDSGDRSSALLLDNIEVAVPFKFSPTLGLLIVGIGIGSNKLRKRWMTNSN